MCVCVEERREREEGGREREREGTRESQRQRHREILTPGGCTSLLL